VVGDPFETFSPALVASDDVQLDAIEVGLAGGGVLITDVQLFRNPIRVLLKALSTWATLAAAVGELDSAAQRNSRVESIG